MTLNLNNYIPDSGSMDYTTTGAITAGSVNTSGSTSAASISTTGSITAGSATAVTAGGSTNGLTVSSTANLGVFVGSGAPTISAAHGSLYLRTDGSSTSTRAYIDTDGATTWTAITTAT